MESIFKFLDSKKLAWIGGVVFAVFDFFMVRGLILNYTTTYDVFLDRVPAEAALNFTAIVQVVQFAIPFLFVWKIPEVLDLGKNTKFALGCIWVAVSATDLYSAFVWFYS